MMEAAISITPFGFDRVFRFGSAPEEEAISPLSGELQAHVAALQERIDQLCADQEMAVLKARSEGMAQGLAQARAERAEALLAATDALHAAIDDLDDQLARIGDRIAGEAAEVALCAAEMIAGHAMKQEPARAIDEALGRALKQVARGTALHVRVHPDNMAEVERLVAERRAGERRALSITIVPSQDIALHDAHIGWAEGGVIIDAAERRAAVARELHGLVAGDGDVGGEA